MKSEILFIIFILSCILCGCQSNSPALVSSPDGKLAVELKIIDGKPYYNLKKNDDVLLGDSKLGLVLKEQSLDSMLNIINVKYRTFDEMWATVWGEEVSIRNHFHEMTVSLQEQGELKRKIDIVFRVFNDGIGFRYEFPKQEGLNEFVIMDEETSFNVVEDRSSWSIPYNAAFYEDLYRVHSLTSIDTVSTPLTIVNKKGTHMAIHEANLTDYAAMNLYSEAGSSTLRLYLTPWSSGEKVFVSNTRVSPWRTIIVADDAASLMLSRLMLNLNEPIEIEDPSWISTGKYIGIWWGIHMKHYTWEYGSHHGATTENTMRYIDFAAKHGFQGVLVEGWNRGWEDWKSYIFTEPYPDFDIAKITDYGTVKGVSLIGHHETGGSTSNYEKQLDSAFAYYNKYGVHTVKTGYVGGKLDDTERHSSQYGVRHYRKVIETAAKYHIMIDNHEPVIPTGLQRTYPNLMTQEGARGQEWNAWSDDGGNPPSHTTILPFTRGLAGPLDYTPVIFNFDNVVLPDTRTNTTLAKELALFVVLYSPWQMAADMIEHYETNPEPFEFIVACPTDWSKTEVPHAKIGEYLTVVRKERGGDDWFLGSITNENKRILKLPLHFLDKGAVYTAHVYQDGDGAHYSENPYPVNKVQISVKSDMELELALASGGGQAIWFEKH